MRWYQYDEQNIFVGFTDVTDESIPESSTDIPPMEAAGGKVPIWNGTAWELLPHPNGPITYIASNVAVTYLGTEQPLAGLGNTYYADTTHFIVVETDITDASGSIQVHLDATALGYPPVLQVPIVKIAKGDPAVNIDEIYFMTTLIEGHLKCIGKFPSSGNWKIMDTRVNESILAITRAWKVLIPTITFYVNELPTA